MSLSPFTQPNYAAQSATAYPTAIDNAVAVMKRVAALFAAREADPPDMTVVVDAGAILVGATLTEVAQQVTGTITAPSGDPRIDRVVIDAVTGVLAVVQGAEDPTPAPPSIPAGKLPVCQVALTVGMTEITNADMTDERAGGSSGTGLNPGSSVELTLSGGAATVTGGNHSLDTQGDAGADDCDTLDVSAIPDGALFVLKGENPARVVTLKHATDNITLAEGDCRLSTAGKRIVLQKVGSDAVEVQRTPTYFESSEQTVTADTLLNVAHGLGAAPKRVEITLRCKTTDAGYAVGDEVLLSGYGSHSGASDAGVDVGFNATNVFVVQGTEIRLLGKASFDNTLLTLSNWRWVVRAWA